MYFVWGNSHWTRGRNAAPPPFVPPPMTVCSEDLDERRKGWIRSRINMSSELTDPQPAFRAAESRSGQRSEESLGARRIKNLMSLRDSYIGSIEIQVREVSHATLGWASGPSLHSVRECLGRRSEHLSEK